MKREAKIAIILVNYKSASDTIECLDSILALRPPTAENGVSVVVVENGSSDDSRTSLSHWVRQRARPETSGESDQHVEGDVPGNYGMIRVTIVFAKHNLGFAAGCNLGLRHSYSDPGITHFWLLNNDTIVHVDAAIALLACSNDHSGYSICGSTLIYHDDSSTLQAAGGAKYLYLIGRSRHLLKRRKLSEISGLRTSPPDYIVGASMFFSRKVLEDIGYLPEHYFLYVEEVDWCSRAVRRGVSLTWASESLVYHKEGRSSGADSGFRKLSDNAFYYIARNNLIYIWKYKKIFTISAVVYLLLEALLYSARSDPGKLRVAIRSLRDFWRLRDANDPEHTGSLKASC